VCLESKVNIITKKHDVHDKEVADNMHYDFFNRQTTEVDQQAKFYIYKSTMFDIRLKQGNLRRVG
jgi:hypothetical protein